MERQVAVSSLLAVIAAHGACADPPSMPDPDFNGDGTGSLATLEINSVQSMILAGSQTVVSVVARDAQQRVLAGVPVQWASSNASVASINVSGVVSGLSEGTTSITATNGDIVSNSIKIDVSGTAGSTALRLRPSQVILGAGTTYSLEAIARDGLGNRMVDAELEWESLDEAVVAVNEHGVLSGKAAGSTTVMVSMEDGPSAAAIVSVIASGTFYEVAIEEPQFYTTVDAAMNVKISVREIDAASQSRIGSPVVPSALELLLGDTPVAVPPAESMVNHLLNVSAQAEGNYELRARAQIGEQAIDSEPVPIRVQRASANTGWTMLGNQVQQDVSGDVSVGFLPDDTPVIAFNRYGGQMYVRRYNSGNNQWQAMAQTTWTDPEADSDNTTEILNTRHWSSTWWPTRHGESVRFALDAHERPVAAWSEEGPARPLTDDGVHLPSFRNDILVRRYRTDPARWEYLGGSQTNIQPLDHERTDDCIQPVVLLQPNLERIVVVYSCGDTVDFQWRIYADMWNETSQQWEHPADPSPEFVDQLRVLDASFEGDRLLVLARDLFGVTWLLVRNSDGEWQDPLQTPRLVTLSRGSGGQLVGAALQQGDARVQALADTTWVGIGALLNRVPDAWAWDADLRQGPEGTIVTVWSEGSEFNRDIHVTSLASGSVSWQAIGTAINTHLDVNVIAPAVGIDSQGRIVAAWIEIEPDSSNPYRGSLRAARYNP